MTPEERAANLSVEWTGEGEKFSVELYGLAVDAIRAAEAAAYRRGAEAFRDAAVDMCELISMPDGDERYAEAIHNLPLPEPHAAPEREP